MQNEKEIAVRLYANQKLGQTYARGLRHTAVFNAAADLRDPHAKYLLDFHTYARWQHTAKTDAQMEALEVVRELADEDTLVSWIQHYDCRSKIKQSVIGVAVFDLNTNVIRLCIDDELRQVRETWELTARPCREVMGKNSPTLLATNADLDVW